MRVVRANVWFGLSLGLAAVSCGSSDDGPPAPRPNADQIASLARASCAYLERCEPWNLRQRYGDAAGCFTLRRAEVENEVQLPDTSTTASQVEYCERQLATHSCSDRTALPDCWMRGTRRIGEPCASGSQCASGSCILLQRLDGPTPSCGVCSVIAGEGEACTHNICALNLTCSSSMQCIVPGREGARCADARDCAGDHDCRDGRCGPRLPVDAPCSDTTAACREGLVCIRRADGSAKCGAPRYAGGFAACGPDPLAGTFTSCSNGACSRPEGGTCLPNLPYGAACSAVRGAKCEHGSSCVDGVCRVYFGKMCE